jgi:LysR family hydrogen peroxide-inducible transcriptional activator
VLEDFARARAPVLSGSLRLGVIPSVVPYLLPKVLPNLKALYPDLALQISETQTERLVAQLLDGDIDLLLLALPILDPGITTRVLFDDPFVLAAPNRVAENADPLTLLAEEKELLLEDGHCLRDQALSFCADRKTGAFDAFGASTLATVVQLVAADLGITLLPAMAASLEAGRAPIRLLPFQDPAPARSIGLAWRTVAART